MTRPDKLPIAKIRINGRHRKDLGDIPSLAASIANLGVLQPLVVDSNLALVCGERRLEAIKSLGWSEAPIRVVEGLDDALKALEAERDENTERKPLTPSEAVALGESLEVVARREARERQKAGAARAGQANRGRKRPRDATGDRQGSAEAQGNKRGRGKKKADTPTAALGGNGQAPTEATGNGSGNLPEPLPAPTRERVGAAVGMSGSTYEKAKKVIEAAEAEPEKYGEIKEEMDRTGKVDGAFKKLQAARKAEEEARKSEVEREKDRIRRGYEQWDKMLHELAGYFIGLDSLGGIRQVAKKWGADVKRGYCIHLRETGDRFHRVADELEEMV